MTLPKNFKFTSWRYSRFDSPSDSGDRYKIVYSSKFEDDGTLTLFESGKEDLYDYIQSFADSVDINNILARYEMGENDALNQVEGFFFDASEVPENMAELLNKLNAAEEGFNRLPTDFKEKYGNDFARFICTFDPSDFVSSVDEFAAAPEEVIKEDENES